MAPTVPGRLLPNVTGKRWPGPTIAQQRDDRKPIPRQDLRKPGVREARDASDDAAPRDVDDFQVTTPQIGE